MSEPAAPTGPTPWTPGQVAKRAGVPLVGLLLVGSSVWAVPHIEDTLERDTVAALEAKGIDTSTLDVDFDYRSGSISGEVDTDLVGARLDEVDVDGARELSSSVTGRPVPEPADTVPSPSFDSEVTVVFDADRVLLDGEVGTGRDRDALISAAGGSGRRVDGDVEVTGPELGGTTIGPVDALGLILGGLPAGSTGSALLSGPALTIDATVQDEAGATALDEAIGRARAVPGIVFGITVDVAALPTDDPDQADEADDPDDPADAEPDPDQADEPTDVGDADALAAALAAIGPIPFADASAELTDGSQAALDVVAEALRAEPAISVLIVGHTDNTGEPLDNQVLSEERAVAVVDYLAGLGIDVRRLIPAGRGEDDPTTGNGTAAGRLANQRVTFEVLGGGNS